MPSCPRRDVITIDISSDEETPATPEDEIDAETAHPPRLHNQVGGLAASRSVPELQGVMSQTLISDGMYLLPLFLHSLIYNVVLILSIFQHIIDISSTLFLATL